MGQENHPPQGDPPAPAASQSTADEPKKDVVYSVVDKSLLLPFFKPYLFKPLAAKIPDSVAANTITLTGGLCSLGALIAMWQASDDNRIFYFISGALMFIYMTLDNLDGAHARRTGQSSPMGEFIDHWLDTASSGLIVAAVAWALALPTWLILTVIGVNGIAFFGTFWEQHTTGNLQMEPMGNIEALTLSAMLLTAFAITGPWLGQHEWFGIASIATVLPVTQIVTLAFTAGGAIKRTKRPMAPWIHPTIGPIAIVLWHVYGQLDFVAATTMIVLCNPVFAGGRIVARVLSEPAPSHGIGPIALLSAAAVASIAFDLPVGVQAGLSWAIALYLFWRAFSDFVRTTKHRSGDLRSDEFLGWFFVR